MKIANAPCSWGVLVEYDQGEQKTYAQVLDEISQSGYAGTELGDFGFMPTEATQLQNELRRRNLSMLAAFVPVDLSNEKTHAAGRETAIKTAKLLAGVSQNPFIVLADDTANSAVRTKNAGRITPELQLTEQQWKTFARGAEEIAGAVLEATGIKTVFHHHCAGYIETPAEVDRFLSMTNPLLIGLCLDTGHYTFGGGDAAQAFERHADRIWHVHFKDCQPELAEKSKLQEWNYFQSVQNGIFCELGKGTVDFQSIVAKMRERAYEGWIVVEQDVLPGMGSPLESAIRNRKYLQELGL